VHRTSQWLCTTMFVVALPLLVASLAVHDHSGLAAETNPVERVVGLIRGLKSKIESDGKMEQKVYDKFACWCEETSARKAAAIEQAKSSIETLSKNIVELNGRLGSSSAEKAQLKKDIAETKESILKAEEMRSKENADFLKTKAALEQAIANLEKAITVLGGLPQQSRKGFINAKDGSPMGDSEQAAAAAGLMETNVLTVAAGIRNAMHLYAKTNDVKDADLSSVKSFLVNPAAFLSTGATSPHKGTYNTQSTAIQGILSEMYETFERDLEDAKTEEGEKKAAFDELHKTKTKDQGLLEATLIKKNKENGDDTKQLADDETEREETQAQLKTDEAFFETTTESCKAKADEWAERSRLRTEELAGIGQAIDILTSSEAKAIFNKADTTFVQLSVVTKSKGDSRTRAYGILKETATKTSSLKVALIASSLSTTGHFDQVMGDIDKMIVALRDEETADVAHKDWCETERSNSNSKNEALEYDMTELKSKVQRLESKDGELDTAISQTETEMGDLELAMTTALNNRNAENGVFKQALKDDTDAVALIGKAMESLGSFYANNAFLQKKHEKAPVYAANEDTAPETFGGEGGGYGGRSSENTGIVAILGMIKEDLEKEIAKSQEDEAASLAAYQKLYDESADTMQALTDKKTTLQSDVADTQTEITNANSAHSDTSGMKGDTDDYLTGLKTSCDWIDRTFVDRRSARKAEIKGLQEAKSVLAGAAPGEAEANFAAMKTVGGKQHTSVQDELRDLDKVESHFEASFLQRNA